MTDWESLCIELNFDEDGRVLEVIKKEHNNDLKACCREVLMRWLKGEGDGPRTWSKLIDCLNTIGAAGAVSAIKEHLLKGKPHGDVEKL